MRGRLAFLRGDLTRSLELLGSVRAAGEWPVKGAVRARNHAWYGEALEGLGRSSEALEAFRSATRVAPSSYWGTQARRKAALID